MSASPILVEEKVVLVGGSEAGRVEGDEEEGRGGEGLATEHSRELLYYYRALPLSSISSLELYRQLEQSALSVATFFFGINRCL